MSGFPSIFVRILASEKSEGNRSMAAHIRVDRQNVFFEIHCWTGKKRCRLVRKKSCKKLKFVEEKFDQRIAPEKVNFVKKGSPKNFSTQLFFMWTRNHLNVLMRKKYVKNRKKQHNYFLRIFYFCQKKISAEKNKVKV